MNPGFNFDDVNFTHHSLPIEEGHHKTFLQGVVKTTQELSKSVGYFKDHFKDIIQFDSMSKI